MNFFGTGERQKIEIGVNEMREREWREREWREGERRERGGRERLRKTYADNVSERQNETGSKETYRRW